MIATSHKVILILSKICVILLECNHHVVGCNHCMSKTSYNLLIILHHIYLFYTVGNNWHNWYGTASFTFTPLLTLPSCFFVFSKVIFVCKTCFLNVIFIHNLCICFSLRIKSELTRVQNNHLEIATYPTTQGSTSHRTKDTKENAHNQNRRSYLE